MAIVYTHTRNDNGQVFYVGIGDKESRAYDKRSRNRWWINIANKCDFTVNITHRDIIWEEACAIEKYLIAFYGRRDLGEGVLVNLTDGGDGVRNLSAESISRRMKTCMENGEYERMKQRLAKYKGGRTGDAVYAYTKDGLLCGYFKSKQEFGNYASRAGSAVSKAIDKRLTVGGYYIYSEYKGVAITDIVTSKSRKQIAGKKNVKKYQVVLLNTVTGLEHTFDSYCDASNFLGKNDKYVAQAIGRGKDMIGNYKIKFY